MKLEINGNIADLGDQKIALTRQAISLENPSLALIDITNRFTLPPTEVNHKIFNGARVLSSNSDALDVLYKSKITDEFPIFNGKGFLNEYSKGYRFQLSEQSKAFFDDLNVKINKLDLSAADHVFDYSSYFSLKGLTSKVFTYPLVSMGAGNSSYSPVPPTVDASMTYYRPFLSFSVMLNKIFTSRGWTVNYDDLDLLDNIVLSTNAKNFYVTSYEKTLSGSWTAGNITALNTNDFENNVTTTSTTIDIKDLKTKFRLRGTVALTSDITVTFKATDSHGTPKVKESEYIIKSTETEIDITTSAFQSDDDPNSVEVIISGTGSITFSDTLLYTIIEEGDIGNISTNPCLDYKVLVYDNMPNYTQKDLFKFALAFTNSFIIPDSFNKTIYIKSLNKNSKLNSYDWSEKDEGGVIKITNRYNSFAQKNYLKYTNDEYTNSTQGESFFNVVNESLEDETDYLKLKSGASDEVVINSETMADFGCYDTVERIADLNDRFLYVVDGAGAYTLGQFNQLDFKVLQNEYYKNYLNSFSRLRVIERYFNLKKSDVLGFDFNKLVYSDKLKSHFLVLKIENFIPNRPTKVLLLKWL